MANKKDDKSTQKFTKDLRNMMFGFGDVRHPLPETVDLMESIVTEYIVDMTKAALEVGSSRAGKARKLSAEDVVFLVRKDPKKFARAQELLKMQEELKNARKQFDVKE